MPATFTLSIDLELAWGEFYRRPVDVERMAAARRVFPQFLALLERTGVAATFAVVGHLLLEGCDGHPDMPRPSLEWRPGDWYAGDPCTDEGRDPAWYAPSLVRSIRAAGLDHDVGAHGFSHLPFDVAGVGPEVVSAELAKCATVLGEPRAGGHSLVFPRNGVKYTRLLRQHGFSCYREAEHRWYSDRRRAVRKIGHMLDQALAITPDTGTCSIVDGVATVPSSMLFLSREGFRRWMPMTSRVTRARRGIARALATGDTFHLWLHAEDLVPDEQAMLSGLEAVLRQVRDLVSSERMVVRTMADLAAAAMAEERS